ncbi:MAG: type II toxin-antitoxin system RelE/ParE family toxin [Sedimentisphaerales bacterium]|nr:type II toxin-antitoxin system RelE/ParE family toxin [Sedimentisphaerales bacterium]
MEKYNVVFTKSSVKELDEIPPKDAKRIFKRISDLAANPRPMGCEKLSARPLYRIRQGDYRIIYFINDSSRVVDIIKIGHRREIYRL